MAGAQAQSAQIEHYVSTQEAAWGWAQAVELPELRKRVKELQSSSQISRLWYDFFVHKVSDMKKKYYMDGETLTREAKSTEAINTHAESLERQTQKMNDLQQIHAKHA